VPRASPSPPDRRDAARRHDPRGGRPRCRLGRSNGFEALAISADHKTLYPILEGPVTGDDPTTRRVYAFDLPTRRYVDRLPDYRVSSADLLVSDATTLEGKRLVVLERDNFQGSAAQHKRGFVIDLRCQAPDGTLVKRQVVDLLNLRDPAEISLPARPGDVGLGEHFSMPYVTIESVLPLGGNRLAIVNDTNFGSTGRNPGLPDPSDFIIVQVPGLHKD
jgi:glycerophosphoryl diester phosphodiesterase